MPAGYCHRMPSPLRRIHPAVNPSVIPNVLRLSVAALCVLAIASCGKGARGQARGGFQMPPMPVEVAKVEPQRVRDQFKALGSIEASENIQVTTEYNGTVRDLPFTEGQ